jgi:hypothetical protein
VRAQIKLVVKGIGVALAFALLALTFGTSGDAVAGPYPPAVCSTLAISTTTPHPGQTMVITGTGFKPGSTVTLLLHSDPTPIGSATVKADGTFTANVTLPPKLYGPHLITASGGSPTCPVDPLQVDIQKPAGPPTPSSNNPLPFTGVDILGALAIALALITLGLLLNRRGGRRRHHAHHSG